MYQRNKDNKNKNNSSGETVNSLRSAKVLFGHLGGIVG